MAELDELVAAIEAEYDRTDGFIGQLFEGRFDDTARKRFLRTLEAIDSGTGPTISRRLATALWSLPLLILWNTEKFDGEANYLLGVTRNITFDELERILGPHP